MGALDNLNPFPEQAGTGQRSEPELQTAYDKVSQNAPREAVQDGLAQAFRSDRTPPFAEMVAHLFGRSDSNQKAGLLNTLLGKLQPEERRHVLGDTGAAGAPSANVPPETAAQIKPEQVAAMASQAERRDPSIVDQAASFYAQHPGLVKTLGGAALTVLLARAAQPRHG